MAVPLLAKRTVYPGILSMPRHRGLLKLSRFRLHCAYVVLFKTHRETSWKPFWLRF